MFGRKKNNPAEKAKIERLEKQFLQHLKSLDDYFRYFFNAAKLFDFSKYTYGDGGHVEETEKSYRIDLKHGHYTFDFTVARNHFLNLVDSADDLDEAKKLVSLYVLLKSAQYHSDSMCRIRGELNELNFNDQTLTGDDRIIDEIAAIRNVS